MKYFRSNFGWGFFFSVASFFFLFSLSHLKLRHIMDFLNLGKKYHYCFFFLILPSAMFTWQFGGFLLHFLLLFLWMTFSVLCSRHSWGTIFPCSFVLVCRTLLNHSDRKGKRYIGQWHSGGLGTERGSDPGRSGRRIFFSRVNIFPWHLFWYPFHPCVTLLCSKHQLTNHCVTTVACTRSQSFCPKCRCQVTAKQTCTLPVWLWIKWHCKLVCGVHR